MVPLLPHLPGVLAEDAARLLPNLLLFVAHEQVYCDPYAIVCLLRLPYQECRLCEVNVSRALTFLWIPSALVLYLGNALHNLLI